MIEELNKICKIIENADLTIYNTYRLNSFCDVLASVNNIEELKSVINVLKKYKSKWFIIGNGSNIILPSHYDGVVIKLDGFNDVKIYENKVYVESCYMINKLALMLVNNGYKGLEWASGIPGTIGGSVYGNAGCYGSSISEVLISATIFDGENIVKLTNNELNFKYRYSLLKENKNYIILSCEFKIEKSNKNELKELVSQRTKKRIESQDLTHPSCGSVFRNPEGTSAWKLIDGVGLKGYNINGAMISNKHANFIINNGDATGKDIIKLIELIKKEVKNKYNIDLILEQEIIK